MTRLNTLLKRLESGWSDRSFRFDDLCTILDRMGFSIRVRGSHHIFTREGLDDILNLQPLPGGMAKPYQVRQVRRVLQRLDLFPPDSASPGASDET